VRCSRFARSCVRLIGCRNWAVGSIMLTGLLFLGSADAQASRLQRPRQQPPPKTIVLSTTDGIVSPPSPTAAPTTVPPPLAIEVEQSPAQPPAQAPVISWDGKQLTIDAENTSLSEILLAIRSRTGASIEMPPSTSSERVAVHMGPAPVREVLSSLLYGTDFNYVIQSSDGDEEGLGKVIITAREKDGSEDASASNTSAGRGVRLMPGYAAPGKRDFEVKHANTENDASAQSETSNAAAGDVASQAVPDAVSENPQSASKVDAQPVPSTAGESADTSVPASDAGVGSMGLAQPSASAAIASSSNGGSGDGSSISKMEQDLQRLYQQRMQMQAQQNHSQPQGPGN
jgi:hypothetical protein